MIDSTANLHSPADHAPAKVAMPRLAVRVIDMEPPLDLSPASIMQPPPAVTAANATRAAIAKRADERARRSRSVIVLTVDSFVSACSFIPYALVALALRLVMARVFFSTVRPGSQGRAFR